MSAARDYIEYLKDMLLEAKYAQQFLHRVEYDDFAANPEKQRAVIRSIEIVGEASTHIPEQIRDQYPQIEWSDIRAIRNRLIHGYTGISLVAVWNTVKEDLPVLQVQLEEMLAEMDSAE
jgi:uncharacterized protein with HEPN domain